VPSSNDAPQIAALQLQVQQISAELASAQQIAAAATAAAAEQHARVLQDSQEATEAAEQQLASLKDVIRTMSADRTTAEGAAIQIDRALSEATAEMVQLRAALAAAEQQTAAADVRGDAMAAAAREEGRNEAAQKLESLQSELESRTAEASLNTAIAQSAEQAAVLTAAAAAQLNTAEADTTARTAAAKLSLEASEAIIAEKEMQIVDLKQSHRTEIATATEASKHAITAAEQASNSVLFLRFAGVSAFTLLLALRTSVWRRLRVYFFSGGMMEIN